VNVYSWDERYARDIANYDDHGDEGDIWFGTGAEQRIASHFISRRVPTSSAVCDCGCGNGAMLRRLVSGEHTTMDRTWAACVFQRRHGYTQLTGVDYSEAAVQLARTIDDTITYTTGDLCSTEPFSGDAQFDLLVDKGTLDAISLSADRSRNIHAYLTNCRRMLKIGSPDDSRKPTLIICSCNFAESELIQLLNSHGFVLDYVIPAKHEFVFGGQRGQTCCVCVFVTSC
jgi:trans-aconitate methyltransferase